MSDLDQMLDLIKRHREVAVLAALPLDSGSRAVVAGSYKGDTVAFLRGLYDMEVIGFEPQGWAYGETVQRFAGDSKVELFNFGLGTSDATAPMGEWGTDACSFVPDPAARTYGVGQMRDASQVLNGLDVDLVVFNLEGYEYELIPHIEASGILRNIKHIVIQLHDMDRMPYEQLLGTLAKNHVMRWSHSNWSHWTWQSWELVA